MSTYHTPADVSAELKNIGFSAVAGVSIINSTYIQSYCDQTEAEVEGFIGKKYVIPIDKTVSPKAFNLTTMICVKLTAGRADEIIRRENTNANINPDQSNKIKSILAEGNKLLKDVINDLMILVDAQRILDLKKYVGFDRPAPGAVAQPYLSTGSIGMSPLNMQQCPAPTKPGPTIVKGYQQW